MHFNTVAAAAAALFVAGASAQTLTIPLPDADLALWNSFKDTAANITVADCSTQIIDTWTEANAILNQFGFSGQFIDAVLVKQQALASSGNLPAASGPKSGASSTATVAGDTAQATSLIPKAGLVSAAPTNALTATSAGIMAAAAIFGALSMC
ncbi:hypothetical protein BC831DRAFT_44287 [Entophlyctis helioformis]|nr:hypothetical protein BC831DRAFT_44287 [Entophlyctis helioformis]